MDKDIDIDRGDLFKDDIDWDRFIATVNDIENWRVTEFGIRD